MTLKPSQSLAVLVCLSLVCLSFLVGVVGAADDWVIDGSKVYIDDSRVYLSAEPHTIFSPGWVTFTLESKQFTGDIDVVWGFPLPDVKPKKAQLYAPYYNNWTTEHQETFYYVTSFTPVENGCEYGYDYNTFHYSVDHSTPEYDKFGNISGWTPTTSIVCFDSYEWLDANNCTVTWQQKHSEYIEWVDMNGDSFEIIQKEHGGMNTWYLLKNVPVEAGNTYKLRAWVSVPISNKLVSGKYWWCLKPSSLSISDAIAQDKFYALDPWYNAQWSHRKTITVTNPTAETLTNFPVLINVSYEAEMQNDFEDCVFTDTSSVIRPFELDYYADSSYALFWCNVSSIPASSFTTLYMYYGNDGAVSQEDPEGVWVSSAVMVQHMKDDPDTSHITDSTSYDNDGTKKGANEPVETTGIIDDAQYFDGTDDYVDCGNNTILNLTTLTISVWVNRRGETGATQALVMRPWKDVLGGAPYFSYYLTYDRNNNNEVTLGLGFTDDTFNYYSTSGGTLNLNTWYHIVATYDGNVNIYINGVNKHSTLVNKAIKYDIDPLLIGKKQLASSDNAFNGTIDEVRIYNLALSADEINASYQFVTNQSSYVEWGEELNYTEYPCLPENLTYELDVDCVNFSWDNVTGECCNVTSYNVSVTIGQNTTWYNGTTNTSITICSDLCSLISIAIWSYSDNCTYNLSFEPAEASINTTCEILFTNCPSCLPVDGCGCIYYDFNVTDTGANSPFFSITPDVGTLNNSTGVFTWCQNLSDWLNTTENLSFGVQILGLTNISYCNVTIGCFDSFIYLQNLLLTEEQNMLGEMWLFLILLLIDFALIFFVFKDIHDVFYGDGTVTIASLLACLLSVILSFMLAFQSLLYPVEMPELNYFLLSVGVVMGILFFRYILQVVATALYALKERHY